MKKCTKCKTEKSLENFYFDKKKKKHYSMCKICYLENYKETRKRYRKKYYHNNKEELIKSVKKWREENRKKFRDADNKRWKTLNFKNNVKYIYKIIKQNSKSKNRELLITQEEFINWYNLQEKHCFYCGIDTESINRCGFSRFQIDRVDNNIPYQKDNIVLACHYCNKTKSNILDKDEMLFIGNNVIIKKWKKILESQL